MSIEKIDDAVDILNGLIIELSGSCTPVTRALADDVYCECLARGVDVRHVKKVGELSTLCRMHKRRGEQEWRDFCEYLIGGYADLYKYERPSTYRAVIEYLRDREDIPYDLKI